MQSKSVTSEKITKYFSPTKKNSASTNITDTQKGC